MSRRIAPLNALRAFEAAARHLSFTKAARELNVTPAAVSHQVKALEDFVGLPLFRRMTRALLLTDAGQLAVPALREGFDRLAEASERLRAHQGRDELTISVAPSFAAKWLVPRLDRFRAAHPGIELRIDASDEIIDLARDGVDLGLRFGRGDYAGLHAVKLFGEETFPVCAPSLLEGAASLQEPGDLSKFPLLHVDWRFQDDTWPNWRMWLLAAGVRDVDASRGPRFSMESMAVQAAIEGQCVAMASSVLVADDLAAGRLVKPFDLCLCAPVNFAYYLVYPKASAMRAEIQAFHQWVTSEARGEAQVS
jgi:LysR family glycine cleavage system transcriptional activator